MRILFVLICFLLSVSKQQTLNGEIRSIFTYETCEVSPLINEEPLIDHGQNDISSFDDKTPCGILQGQSTNITEIRIFLEANRQIDGDNIIFRLNHIPDDIDQFDVNSETICSGTRLGNNCKYIKNPLDITFTTSQFVSAYPLIKRRIDIPYGFYWENCTFNSVGDLPSIFNHVNRYAYSTGSHSCNDFLQGNDPNCRVANNVGPISNLPNGQVCPSDPSVFQSLNNAQNQEDFFVFPKTFYKNNDQCNMIHCPQSETNNQFDLFTVRELGPNCNVFDMQPNPRGILNAEIFIEGFNSDTNTTFEVSRLDLSTLQEGRLEIDTERLLLGQVLNLNLGTGIVGEARGGKIITCSTCVNEQQGEECIPGYVSDIPEDQLKDYDSFIGQTINPWKNGVQNEKLMIPDINGVCTVPTRKCRQMLLGEEDNDDLPFWVYLDELQSNTYFGNTFNKLDMSSKSLLDPNVATQFCLSGLNGDGVPGYEQTDLFNEQDVVTVCEMILNWSNLLTKTNQRNLNFDLGMPDDFNFEEPQYWLHNNLLYRDALSSGSDEVSIDVVLFLTGDVIGEVIEITTGKILNVGLNCDIPVGSTSGQLVVEVENTGQLVGNFRLIAEFSNPSEDPQALDVGNLQPVVFEIEPQEIKEVQITDWSYNGPFEAELTVTLSLFTDDVQAFVGENGSLLDKVEGAGCTITAASSNSGVFNDIYDVRDYLDSGTKNNDDDENCTLFEFSCWNMCGSDFNLLICMSRMIIVILIGLFFFALLGTVFFLWINGILLKKINKNKDIIRSQQIERKKKEIQRQDERTRKIIEEMNPDKPNNLSKKSGYRIKKYMTMLTIVLMINVAYCQVEILDVSSFNECINPLSSPDLNCTLTSFSTTMDLRVTTTFNQQNGTEPTNNGIFLIDLTVVPLSNNDQQEESNECNSDEDERCQLSVPATVTIKKTPGNLRYKLNRLENSFESYIPYAYYFNSQSSLLNEDNVRTLINEGYRCRYISFDNEFVNQPSIDSQNILTEFQIDNQAHYRCSTGTEFFDENIVPPPIDILNAQTAKLDYYFSCIDDDFTDNDENEEIVIVTNEFYETSPRCGIYSIENPPELSTEIEIEVRILPGTNDLFPDGLVETLTLDTITQNLQGATGVSSPLNFFTSKIISVLTPDGLIGPSLEGYIIMCDDDDNPETSGDFNMSPSCNYPNAFDENNTNLNITNPFQCSSSSSNGEYAMPYFPDDRDNIFNSYDGETNNNNNAHRFFTYLNVTKVPSVCNQCGCLGVDPLIYRNPPTLLELNILRSSGTSFPIENIIPINDCPTGFDETQCSEFQDFLTCVPNFGVNFLGLDVTTPCQQLANYLNNEEQMKNMFDDANISLGQLRSLRFEGLPIFWNNIAPNFWVENRYLYYQPLKDTIAVEILLSFSGTFVDYIQTKPNGRFSRDIVSTFCNFNITDQNQFSGYSSFKVCNLNPIDQFNIASYEVNLQCGAANNFNTVTSQFINETSVITIPSLQTISNLDPQSCIVSSNEDNGLTDFVLQLNDFNQYILTESTGIVCKYTLFSLTDFNPRSVILDELALTCQTTIAGSSIINGDFDLPYYFNQTDGYFDPPGQDNNNNNDDNNNNNTLTIVIWVLIGVFFILLFIGIIFYITQCIKNHKSLNKMAK